MQVLEGGEAEALVDVLMKRQNFVEHLRQPLYDESVK
jgi:hypothetical protein